MKFIDTENSWMDGATIYPKNKPFEADEKLATRIAAQSDTFFEVDAVPADAVPTKASDPEPKPEPKPEPEPKNEPPAEESNTEPDDSTDDSSPSSGRIAKYKGGGWYEMEGKAYRLSELPHDATVTK